ncbi:hypothetical protein B0H10DRAFT_2210141 [Mycena sp. CBHHK59/15]|nr:hypothetical protein B0H10DRAFT_2210141 [Mycena sp. CBHHK59/15]
MANPPRVPVHGERPPRLPVNFTLSGPPSTASSRTGSPAPSPAPSTALKPDFLDADAPGCRPMDVYDATLPAWRAAVRRKLVAKIRVESVVIAKMQASGVRRSWLIRRLPRPWNVRALPACLFRGPSALCGSFVLFAPRAHMMRLPVESLPPLLGTAHVVLTFLYFILIYIRRSFDAIRTPWLDSYFVHTSALGTHTFFMTFLPMLFFFGYDEMGRGLIVIICLGIYFTSVAKDLLCSPRPFAPPVTRLTIGNHHLEYGMPSTHCANSVSLALFFFAHIHELAFPAPAPSAAAASLANAASNAGSVLANATTALANATTLLANATTSHANATLASALSNASSTLPSAPLATLPTAATLSLPVYALLTTLLGIYAVSIIFGRLYTAMHSFTDCTVGVVLGAGLWQAHSSFRGLPLSFALPRALAFLHPILSPFSSSIVSTGTSTTYTLALLRGAGLGAHLDAWVLSAPSSVRVPFTLIPLALLAVNQHPQPVDDCPCFEDAIAVGSVVLGMLVGRWGAMRCGVGVGARAMVGGAGAVMPGSGWAWVAGTGWVAVERGWGDVALWWGAAALKMVFGAFSFCFPPSPSALPLSFSFLPRSLFILLQSFPAPFRPSYITAPVACPRPASFVQPAMRVPFVSWNTPSAASFQAHEGRRCVWEVLRGETDVVEHERLVRVPRCATPSYLVFLPSLPPFLALFLFLAHSRAAHTKPAPAGIVVIFAWRLLAKAALHRALPPTFRFLASRVRLPNRRFYTPATDYTRVPAAAALRPIPSVIDLPSTAVGFEVGGIGSGASPKSLSDSEVNGRGLRRRAEAARGGAVDAGAGGGDVEAAGGGGSGVKHYDADVLTKLIVYAGIAVLACEVMPVLFELFGWGVRSWP